MKMYTRIATQNRYSYIKRKRKDVKYIVIHFTANKGDTAKNNADYFATGNTRQVGAHFFVDKKGDIARSIRLNRTAWAVGGERYGDYKESGGAKYFTKCTNENSVSIELCDCNNVEPYSNKQIKSVRKLIKYIQRYCPNANKIIRHFDVNGKHCPAPIMDDKIWKKFRKEILKK